MARTRRNNRGNKSRNFHSNSPPTSVPTPPSNSGRRSAAVAAATASKASGRQKAQGSRLRSNRGRRGPNSSRKGQAISNRSTNGRGRGRTAKKDNTPLQDPSSYRDDNGEVYRRGDYAYVDSQQAELPYHICLIRDFKMARKETVIAEVKWFYRVSELPEAVYLLLMEDRKEDLLFADIKAKERELFMAFNIDTHPASLLRGKCRVKKFMEVKDSLSTFMEKDHVFFYKYGYKPESRRLTELNEESYVPHSQQAVLPEYLGPDSCDKAPAAAVLDRYSSTDEKIRAYEHLVWQPKLTDEDLLMYLRAARSIALHAGVCMTGYMADGYLAVSSDETTQHAFDVLHKNDYDTEKALLDLVKHPIISHLIGKKKWSKENAVLFGKGMRQFGKNFSKIRKELLSDKMIEELVEYYYYWKKTNAGLSSRNTRRQRKMTHIRLSRSLLKPREITPEKEFMDWESCDEDEEEFKGKLKHYYACRHCYCQDSRSWHHAGPSKDILCNPCRQYFQHYGVMCPLQEKKKPPDFMFKDFHEVSSQDQIPSSSAVSHDLLSPPTTGRKTRNSSGSRGGVSSRPGLRSGKNNKSDTDDEEAEVSGESGDESSGEDEMVQVPIKPKPLQARHSLLDNLVEEPSSKTTSDPASKRLKRDDNVSTLSEDYGSGDSTNGEQDTDNPTKSPNTGDKSPSQSSSSSTHADDEGDSPCSGSGTRGTVETSERTSLSTPQGFMRVTRDTESMCARTDLVYVHPLASEKAMATSTIKVPIPGPGSSAHGGGGGVGGHLLQQHTLPTNVKVPLITPHDPRLPMGPPTMMGFPLPYPPPMTPQNAGGQHVSLAPIPTAVVAPETIKSSSSMERDDQHLQQQQIALWQQQQLAMMQIHPHHLSVQTPSFVTGIPPHSTHAHPLPPPQSLEQSASHKPPQAFIFPEEFNSRRWVEHLASHGAVTPHGIHPSVYPHIMESPYSQQQMAPPNSTTPRQLTAEEMATLTMQGPGGARLVQVPPEVLAAGIPPELAVEQIVAHQQQQLMAALALGGPEPQHMVELRQLETVAQQVMKDPSLLQNPHVQIMLQQREQLILQNNMRMQEFMIQQEMQKKQFVLGQPPTRHDDPSSSSSSSSSSHSRSRPGVIVNQSRPT